MGQKHGCRIGVNTDTQGTIVAEIEAEQALVAANRELIRRMEAKINAAINQMWGI